MKDDLKHFKTERHLSAGEGIRKGNDGKNYINKIKPYWWATKIESQIKEKKKGDQKWMSTGEHEGRKEYGRQTYETKTEISSKKKTILAKM